MEQISGHNVDENKPSFDDHNQATNTTAAVVNLVTFGGQVQPDEPAREPTTTGDARTTRNRKRSASASRRGGGSRLSATRKAMPVSGRGTPNDAARRAPTKKGKGSGRKRENNSKQAIILIHAWRHEIDVLRIILRITRAVLPQRHEI